MCQRKTWVKWFLAVMCLGTARAFQTLYDAGNQTKTIPGLYLGEKVDYMPLYTGESRSFYATSSHTSHTSSYTPPVFILNRVIEVKTQTGQFIASFELLLEWEDQTVCIELDRHAAARPYSHPRHALRSFARRWPRRRQPLRSI